MQRISPADLEKMLAKARAEQWSELVVLDPSIEKWPGRARAARQVFQLTEYVEGLAYLLSSLTNLTSLNLSGCPIRDEGAKDIAALTNLTSLDLSYNRIGAEGAKALAALTNLTSLNLRDNIIGDRGAKALAALTSLTSLNLRDNNIGDRGAKALTALTNLTSLNLSYNRIGAEGAKAILDAWSDAPEHRQFQQLDLRENGEFGDLILTEMLENWKDPQAILAAYRSFRTAEAEQTLRPLNEAKLLVVGSEAVGKTSLLRYLIHNEPRDPSEAKTPGIATDEKIETATWSPEESSVRLNVWDFGGQEMMRGTHRFFLTARSLYLLVLEDRRQDDRSIHDWLKTVRNRGAESPIVVIINKSDDGKQDLRPDEEGLRRTYPNIVTFLRTACNDDDYSRASIQALRHRIIDILGKDERLNHVRDSIPDSWLKVKDAVSDLAAQRSVLPHDEFKALCRENGIEDENEQRSLLRLLHDLGAVVAHGLDRAAPAATKGINLLDPNWLTGAIYQILNQPAVRDQDGEFAREQLSHWLDPHLYGEDRHEFILSMMQDEDIGLCFRLPDAREEHYLIPEALRSSAPDYGVWPKDSLRFRYKYGFLPPGLIPRFIVEAHRELTEKKTRWRTGGVFEVADCKILVEGHVGTSPPRIDIAVSGLQERRRAALQVVLNHFDHVHELNPECEPEARVPLPHRPDLDVRYDDLLGWEGRYGSAFEFPPEGADRLYRVAELLGGLPHEKRAEPREDFPDPSPPDKPPALVPAESNWLSSWRSFSAVCGGAAMMLVAAFIWLPLGMVRLPLAVVFAIGLVVAVFVYLRDPNRYYRRWLSFLIPIGPIHASGVSFNVFGTSQAASGWLTWDGQPSTPFLIMWGLIVIALVAADLVRQFAKQN